MESERLKRLYRERVAPFRTKSFPRYLDYIYVLCEPYANVIRYVGSTNDLVARYRVHIAGKSKHNRSFNAWIHSLRFDDELPRVYCVAAINNMRGHLPRKLVCFHGICIWTETMLKPWLMQFLAESALIKTLADGKGFNSSEWSANLLNIKDNRQAKVA